MYNEAKHTEISEFGAKKGLLQGHAKRQVAHALKGAGLPFETVSAKHFKKQITEGVHRVCDLLMHHSLIGQW